MKKGTDAWDAGRTLDLLAGLPPLTALENALFRARAQGFKHLVLSIPDYATLLGSDHFRSSIRMAPPVKVLDKPWPLGEACGMKVWTPEGARQNGVEVSKEAEEENRRYIVAWEGRPLR